MKGAVDCCKIKNKTTEMICKRTSDSKIFKLPRRFSKKDCLAKEIKGFTMKSSCAPFKECRRYKKKQFLFNPRDKKKSFDVYIDKNPNDTISIKYKTVDDVKATIKKLERIYKSSIYPHKRIWQVAMIMKVRLSAILKHKRNKYPKAVNVEKRHSLAAKYLKFLTNRTKIRGDINRKKMIFK